MTRTGKGVRVAVVDSGVHASHPHIVGVAGGVTLRPDGAEEQSYADTIGHGTAVMAALQEKAPEAEYFAVRIFSASLRTTVDLLLRALNWSIENRMDVVNLSLGTTNPAHRERLADAVGAAQKAGLVLVSAYDVDGTPSLPGTLPGVIGVALDWNCSRETYTVRREEPGLVLAASGYPRPVPGVPPARNLNGISFAVANASGFVIRACEALPDRSYDWICEELRCRELA